MTIKVEGDTASTSDQFWKDKTFAQKVRYIYSHITLEPMIACFIISDVLLAMSVQNFYLEKACRVSLGFNKTVCDALQSRNTANYETEEVEVQKLVAYMTAWKEGINSVVPLLAISFFGSWSDRHNRRKPCILVPMLGQIMMAFSLLLCVYFEKSSFGIVMFCVVFFPNITGSYFTMMVGIYSYIGDITTEQERTVRVGIISLVCSVSAPIGTSTSGILIRKIGFYGVFSMTVVMYSLALFYGIFILKEVAPKTPTTVDHGANDQPAARKSLLADFFDLAHVRETFYVAFKSGEKHRCTKIVLLMMVVVIVVGPLQGEAPLFYLYTRLKFNWSEVEFSLFATYSIVIDLIGTTFSMSIFSELLKIDDALIGAMGSLSTVFSSIVYAFAMAEWYMYLGPVVEIISGAASVSMRSLASKIVCKNELGKINSLFGIVESLAPLAYSPALAAVYSHTLTAMPGAFFLVGGTMSIPGVCLFFWIYKINRAERLQLEESTKTEKLPKTTTPHINEAFVEYESTYF